MKIYKILAILSFLFLICALYIIAITPPTTGYELSIYDAYPLHFWFFLIASIVCGIGILIHQSFVNKKSNWGLVGLFAVVLTCLVLINLHIFRGYAFGDSHDTLAHIGFTKDIVWTGHLNNLDIYPVTHLHLATLSLITELPEKWVLSIFISSIYILYLLGIYLLVKCVSNSQGPPLLAAALASPPLFYLLALYTLPFGLSVLIIPMLLYLSHCQTLYSGSRFSFTIASLIIVLFLVYFHPITALLIVVIFLTFGLSTILCRWLGGNLNVQRARAIPQSWMMFAFIALILFVTWYFSFPQVANRLKLIFESLIHGTQLSPLETYAYSLWRYGFSLSQSATIFIFRAGAMALYLLLALASGCILLLKTIKRENRDPISVAYSLQLLTSFIISAIFLFTYTRLTDIARLLMPPVLLAILLNAFVFYPLIKQANDFKTTGYKFLQKSKIALTLVVVVVITSTFIGVFSFYPSPSRILANQQLTRMAIAGTQWTVEYTNDVIIFGQNTPYRYYSDLVLGRTVSFERTALRYSEPIPSGFGYSDNTFIATALDPKIQYMITTIIDRLYPRIFPDNAVPNLPYTYTEDDFTRLHSDPTVTNIYTNGEFELWRFLR